MKPLNHKERRKSLKVFVLVFGLTLCMLFLCGFFAIKTAKEGIDVLEQKHSEYTQLFQKQAALSYDLDNLIKRLHQIKNSERTLSQHKKFQLIISDLRNTITESINKEENKKNYLIYEELMNQVKIIQNTLDKYVEDNEEYLLFDDLLTKCIERYKKEINKK